MNLLNEYLLVKRVEDKPKEGFTTVSAINELIGKGELIQIPKCSTEQVFNYPPIGSTIYFEKSLGTEFEIEGQKVKFIKLEDVMGYE